VHAFTIAAFASAPLAGSKMEAFAVGTTGDDGGGAIGYSLGAP
jgi:hypothetical protein